MDMYQIRALELETEQLERYRNCTVKENFFKERFERTIADEIARYRRISNTYSRHYTR